MTLVFGITASVIWILYLLACDEYTDNMNTVTSVSYTHLDVYKRQVYMCFETFVPKKFTSRLWNQHFASSVLSYKRRRGNEWIYMTQRIIHERESTTGRFHGTIFIRTSAMIFVVILFRFCWDGATRFLLGSPPLRMYCKRSNPNQRGCFAGVGILIKSYGRVLLLWNDATELHCVALK